MKHLANPVLNRRKDRIFIVDGYAVELWSLKALIGGHFGGVFSHDGRPTVDVLSFDLPRAVKVLTSGKFPPRTGLYVFDENWAIGTKLSFGTLSNKAGALIAIRMALHEIGFCVSLEEPSNSATLTDANRIGMLRLRHNGFSSTIAIPFDGVGVGESVMISDLSRL